MSDTFSETCVVDGAELLECFDADEYGVFTYFVCAAGEHTYPSAYDGIGWSPIDNGDYEPREDPNIDPCPAVSASACLYSALAGLSTENLAGDALASDGVIQQFAQRLL